MSEDTLEYFLVGAVLGYAGERRDGRAAHHLVQIVGQRDQSRQDARGQQILVAVFDKYLKMIIIK